jgi:intracellular sulfur oxidation DsrE/DsrF family protein
MDAQGRRCVRLGAGRYRPAVGSAHNSRVVACENTMCNPKAAKDDIPAGVGDVAAGVAEIMQREQQGWTYLRP